MTTTSCFAAGDEPQDAAAIAVEALEVRSPFAGRCKSGVGKCLGQVISGCHAAAASSLSALERIICEHFDVPLQFFRRYRVEGFDQFGRLDAPGFRERLAQATGSH
jgi:hypothetical protein